jgi:hypothetical protein
MSVQVDATVNEDFIVLDAKALSQARVAAEWPG